VTRVVSGRALWIAIGAVALVLFGYAMFIRGGGAAPGWLDFLSPAAANPLDSSGAEEQVLRSMRLAGIDLAVVGEQRGQAVLRAMLPAVNSAPDLEIAWQSGLAALTTAYPSAREYVVQLFVDSTPLVELRVAGGEGREAAEGAPLADQPTRFIYLTQAEEAPAAQPSSEPTPGALGFMLRGLTNNPWHEPLPVPPAYAARARELVDARPAGATPLPPRTVSVGLELPAEYLDAKNRAAGFIGEDKRLTGVAAELSAVADEARDKAPGIPALPSGTDAARFWQDQIGQTLGAFQARGERADDLARSVAGSLVSPQDTQGVGRVRAIAMTVIAVESGGFAENTSRYAVLSEEVRDVPLPAGPAADAVLVAAHSAEAPEQAKEVVLFERDENLDRGTDALDDSVGGEPPVWGRAAVEYQGPEGRVSVVPEQWLGYRRADGAEFFLAGPAGAVAVTDASIIGWAYELPLASVVDSLDVGIVLAYLDPAR